MAYLLASKMDGAWIMKYILLVLISIISAASFAKTGYENIITFNSSNWISQKTPTGFGLSCKLCDNQLMISMDIVPVNKSNKYTKSNTYHSFYLTKRGEPPPSPSSFFYSVTRSSNTTGICLFTSSSNGTITSNI